MFRLRILSYMSKYAVVAPRDHRIETGRRLEYSRAQQTDKEAKGKNCKLSCASRAKQLQVSSATFPLVPNPIVQQYRRLGILANARRTIVIWAGTVKNQPVDKDQINSAECARNVTLQGVYTHIILHRQRRDLYPKRICI
jgi:hypothetical protein